MPLLPSLEYVEKRQAYDYEACDCNFSITQTKNLQNVGSFSGIFPRQVPSTNSHGINLRRFEIICQEVFRDCYIAVENKQFTNIHLENLQNIAAAIVYWKMASQGGRASTKTSNMLNKWRGETSIQLINAYFKKDISLFRIGGVRIPTASTFLRFLFPNDFGIMDSRVTKNYTQPKGITRLSVRSDNYINDVDENIWQYNVKYIPFLRNEAKWLNEQKITFTDYDPYGNIFNSPFRACDIEMALF